MKKAVHEMPVHHLLEQILDEYIGKLIGVGKENDKENKD
jgi:hypothetical protein